MTALDPSAVSTINLVGEYDLANAASILEQVSVALARAARSVALDASQVTFMDSTALAALVRTRKLCIEAGVPLTS